jgi:hypothetical protein
MNRTWRLERIGDSPTKSIFIKSEDRFAVFLGVERFKQLPGNILAKLGQSQKYSAKINRGWRFEAEEQPGGLFAVKIESGYGVLLDKNAPVYGIRIVKDSPGIESGEYVLHWHDDWSEEIEEARQLEGNLRRVLGDGLEINVDKYQNVAISSSRGTIKLVENEWYEGGKYDLEIE